jgi:hypothetical protein
MGGQLCVETTEDSSTASKVEVTDVPKILHQKSAIGSASESNYATDCHSERKAFLHESSSLATLYLPPSRLIHPFFKVREISPRAEIISDKMPGRRDSTHIRQVRSRLQLMKERKDEHPVCKSLPSCACVEFVKSDILDILSPPWPRNQELSAQYQESICARPTEQDLVVAISHMWYFEKHPDPFGEKVNTCRELISQANTFKRAAGETFLFFDFLSLTQPPFHSTQEPRSPKQDQCFQLALKALPMIYLYSDIILLLDSAAVQSHTYAGEFGRPSTTPASERGWIYLERFIAMIKVAMTPENTDASVHAPVVLSNSPSLLDEIVDGGRKLREAAKAGKRALKDALQDHLQVLQSKTFSAISVDKQTNQGGVAGGPTYSVKMSDLEAVFATMTIMVEKLFQHWGSFADGNVFSYKTLVWEKARLAVMCRRFKVQSK